MAQKRLSVPAWSEPNLVLISRIVAGWIGRASRKTHQSKVHVVPGLGPGSRSRCYE